MDASITRTMTKLFPTAMIAAIAVAPAMAGPRLAPSSAGGKCSYRGVIFANGTTTTFDCPLNPQACYSNAVMLPRWTCRDGKWCTQSGACYAKAFGG